VDTEFQDDGGNGDQNNGDDDDGNDGNEIASIEYGD
jgi:hypothetical protein